MLSLQQTVCTAMHVDVIGTSQQFNTASQWTMPGPTASAGIFGKLWHWSVNPKDAEGILDLAKDSNISETGVLMWREWAIGSLLKFLCTSETWHYGWSIVIPLLAMQFLQDSDMCPDPFHLLGQACEQILLLSVLLPAVSSIQASLRKSQEG